MLRRPNTHKSYEIQHLNFLHRFGLVIRRNRLSSANPAYSTKLKVRGIKAGMFFSSANFFLAYLLFYGRCIYQCGLVVFDFVECTAGLPFRVAFSTELNQNSISTFCGFDEVESFKRCNFRQSRLSAMPNSLRHTVCRKNALQDLPV